MGPLEGLKVIDIGTIFAAPISATLLADMGADVIKIEHPRGDPLRRWGYKKDGIPMSWKVVNRNKKTITLDLSKEKGQELFKILIKHIDVMVSNFRPGVLERWNIGFNDLKKINPRLILVNISGWGQTGPYSNMPGYGTLAEGVSGFAQLNGYPDSPPTMPPTGLADALAGIYGAMAALAAIYNRDVLSSNEGQQIDIALYEPIFSLLSTISLQVTRFDQLNEIPARLGNRSAFEAPRNIYRSKDGKWISMSSTNETMAKRIFTAMGLANLLNDSRFKDNDARLAHVDELDSIISNWMSNHKSTEILTLFKQNDATAFLVYDIRDIFSDQHFKERLNIIEVPDDDFGKIKMAAPVPIFSKTQNKIKHTGLPKGFFNEEIYENVLKLSKEEIKILKDEGVI